MNKTIPVIQHDLTVFSYERLVRDGQSHLDAGRLGDAEKYFAQAFKLADRSKAVAEQCLTLTQLGHIYIQRQDYIRGVGLYCAARVRAHQLKDDAALEALNQSICVAEAMFLGIKPEAVSDSSKYLSQLTALRDRFRPLIRNAIDELLSAELFEAALPGFVERIQTLSSEICRALEGLVGSITEDSFSTLPKAPHPCKTASESMGSLARFGSTLFSDVEWVFLFILLDIEGLSVSDINTRYTAVQRHLERVAIYSQIQVLKLGQTILPSLCVASLNNFESTEARDNWYFDEMVPRGFCGDATLPGAGKVPWGTVTNVEHFEGRGGYVGGYIYSPEDMTLVLAHSPNPKTKEVLYSARHLSGDPAVSAEYQKRTEPMAADMAKLAKERMQTECAEFNPGIRCIVPSRRKLDAKRNLYRITDRLTSLLALAAGARSPITWLKLEELESAGVLNAKGRQNLRTAHAIALAIRHQNYFDHDGQYEAIPYETQYRLRPLLIRFYQIVVPFHQAIEEFSSQDYPISWFSTQTFFDESPRLLGQIYNRLGDFQSALGQFKSLEGDIEPGDTELKQLLGHTLTLLGRDEEAGEYHLEFLGDDMYSQRLGNLQSEVSLHAIGGNQWKVSDGKVVMENPNPAGHKTDDVPTLISSAQQMLAWVDSEGRTKALENLEAARIQEPHSAEVMAHIGLFYFYRAQIDERQEGDLERALQEIQNALASDPPMHLLLNILFCYIHTSNTEAARAVMDRIQAVELEPIREVQHLIFKFDPYWPKQGMSPPFYRQALLDYLDCRLLLLEGKNPEAKTKYEAFMTAVRSEHADLLEICTQEEIDEMFQSASQMGVDFPQLK